MPALANFALAVCLLLLCAVTGAWALPPGTSAVPLPLQDQVEENIAQYLILPETADYHFDFMAPYPGGGDVVCGSVNYQSSLRTYVGAHKFFVVVYRGRITLSQLQDPPSDTSGQEAIKFKLLCDRH